MSSHSEIGYMISANVLGGNAELRSFAEDVGQRHCEEGCMVCVCFDHTATSFHGRGCLLRVLRSPLRCELTKTGAFRVDVEIEVAATRTQPVDSIFEMIRRGALYTRQLLPLSKATGHPITFFQVAIGRLVRNQANVSPERAGGPFASRRSL